MGGTGNIVPCVCVCVSKQDLEPLVFGRARHSPFGSPMDGFLLQQPYVRAAAQCRLHFFFRVWRFKVGPSLALALVGVDAWRDLLEEGRTEETVSCPEHALRGD